MRPGAYLLPFLNVFLRLEFFTISARWSITACYLPPTLTAFFPIIEDKDFYPKVIRIKNRYNEYGIHHLDGCGLFKIYLLGQFKIQNDDQALELPDRSAQSLLAYLALNAGVTYRREKLASLLWPDATDSNARSYLRRALWRMRKSLKTGALDPDDFLRINDISVTYNAQSHYSLDADLLLSRMETCTVEEIIEIARLYRGDLLPGFYDEWVLIERERLQTAYHQMMNHLLDRLVETMRWDEVLYWGEQWIRLGFSPEPAYQALIQAYAGLGNPGMIGLTYQRCVEALERDLGMQPSPETTRLYEQFRDRAPEKAKPSPAANLEPPNPPPFFSEKSSPLSLEKPLVVAREQELDRLNHFLDLALADRGRIVFITGEAGSGKTTLVNEFTRRARAAHPDLIVANGNCNAHTGIGDPYLPFREIMELLTGNVESRWSAGAITRDDAQFLWNLIPGTIQTLLDSGPNLMDTFVSSVALLERAETFPSGEHDWLSRLERFTKRKLTDAAGRNPHQSDLFVQYSKVLQALANRAPLVLVVDDLQWADLGSISLLFHLGRYLSGSRILIVGAYRPEEIALGRSGERHPLEPVINELKRIFGDIEVNVDQADCRIFVDAILDSEPNWFGPQFREMLCQLTRGQPLFTIELLRGMQERGDLLKDENGRWMEGPTLDWETLPARVEAVIAERIGRLNPLWQSILRIASVQGEVFTAEVVAQVQGHETVEIFGRLSNELDRKHRLIRAHSIQRIAGKLLSIYQFQHILVQKYLYNSLDEVERVHLHEQVGRLLENLYENQAEMAVMSPQLARHFLEARNTEKALHYLQQAGERAFQVSAYQEAITHLKKGLDLLATQPDLEPYAQQELSLQLTYSMAYNLALGHVGPEMEQASYRALELSQKVGDIQENFKALNILSILHYVNGEFDLAYERAEESLVLARQAEDPLLIAMGQWCQGIALLGFGDFELARFNFEQVIAVYEPLRHHRAIVTFRGIDAGLSSHAYLAICLWYLGYPEQAVAKSREARELAYKLDHSFSLADVLRYGCCEVDKLRRNAPSLKSHAEELIRLSQNKDFSSWYSAGLSCLGESLILTGRIQAGISLVQEGVNGNLSTGVRCSIPGPLIYLIEAYAGMGDLERGEKVWTEVCDLIEMTGERRWEGWLYRMRAMLQRMRGRDRDAEASLRKALEIAHKQKARLEELRAAIDLAHLLEKQERNEEGRQVVKEIYSWFTEGFDTPELKEARRLCTETA